MKISKRRVQRTVAVTGLAVAGAAATLGLTGCTEQENPVEKTFELKDGTKVTCLVIYDELGEVIEETIACPVVVQPTAKQDK